MKQHQVYSINDTDQFNAQEYPKVTDEAAIIVKQTAGMLPAYKEDMIVSYLKDHAIENVWIAANPSLAALVTSNTLATNNIEALFDASRNNPLFKKQFEAFLKSILQDRVIG